MKVVAWILGIIGALGLFYAWYPPFGGRSKRATFAGSPNFTRRKFINATPTKLDFDANGIWSLAKQELRTHPDRKPRRPLTLQRPDLKTFAASDKPQAIWLGHSSFLVRLQGKTLLFDPVFSKRTSPFWGLGPARFSASPRVSVDDLPPIDAVIISHDHYDHLDYASIRKLRLKTNVFYVPLGLGAHLRRWHVPKAAIKECDWWQSDMLDDIQLVCTPSRHFSGRTLTDRYKTLWASWVVKAPDVTLFFSGDSGYGPHFKEIGEKYGPFDITMMECGQYDKLWPHIHMMPEQTAQAHADLRGKHLIPMHWGAFVLSLHDWTDPVERVIAAAKEHGASVITPRIGEAIHMMEPPSSEQWWKTV